MGLMDFFIRSRADKLWYCEGLNTLARLTYKLLIFVPPGTRLITRWRKRELLEKQREAAVKVKTEAEEQLGVFGLVQILLQKTSDYARQQVKVRIEDIVSEALNVVSVEIINL